MSSAVYDLKGLHALIGKVREAVSAALLQSGKHIQTLASELAPVDSGDLAASGDVQMIAPTIIEVSFGNNLPDNRAVAQEYGTLFMPAQPYLGPAVRAIDVGLEVSKELKKIR